MPAARSEGFNAETIFPCFKYERGRLHREKKNLTKRELFLGLKIQHLKVMKSLAVIDVVKELSPKDYSFINIFVTRHDLGLLALKERLDPEEENKR